MQRLTSTISTFCEEWGGGENIYIFKQRKEATKTVFTKDCKGATKAKLTFPARADSSSPPITFTQFVD